jgi:acetylglutamate kinase
LTGQLQKSIVVKIGGSTLGSEDTTLEDIVYLQKQGQPLVIIHGGGKIITEWLGKQGVATSFVRGERVTDEATLKVVTAVLAGLVNKEIVAAINNLGGRAIGISGADGALVRGTVAREELGYVGQIVGVNIDPLRALVNSGYVPVISPLSIYSEKRSDKAPGLLNNNADIVAGEIAFAIGAARLVFLTDVSGIFDEQGKLISALTSEAAQTLIDSGVAKSGMIPKVRACLRAISSNSTCGIIDGRKPHALLRELETGGTGTVIRMK